MEKILIKTHSIDVREQHSVGVDIAGMSVGEDMCRLSEASVVRTAKDQAASVRARPERPARRAAVSGEIGCGAGRSADGLIQEALSRHAQEILRRLVRAQLIGIIHCVLNVNNRARGQIQAWEDRAPHSDQK